MSGVSGVSGARPISFTGQRKHVVRLRFLPPETPSVDLLQQWRPYLEDPDLPPGFPGLKPDHSPDVAPVASWIDHLLQIARDLLLVATIPCFDRIRLLDCLPRKDREGTYDGVIEVPVFENFSFRVFEAALAEAITCADFMHKNPPGEANRSRLYAVIEREMMVRIARDFRSNTSTLHALHGAYRRGVPFSHLGMGVYQLGWGASARRINRSTSERDSALAVRLTTSKHVTARLLRNGGLPAPLHHLVSTAEAARTAAERVGWPVVVKPADLERGEGVQVDVREGQVETAFAAAAGLSPKGQVLVERQVDGQCHRLFVAGGRLLYAVRRLPIGVYGDGSSTVAQLVAAAAAQEAEKPVWLRSKIRTLDQLGRASLSLAGLSESSVPGAGAFVALRRIETTEWGGTDEEVTGEVHPENLRVALAATRLCGLDTAGIDLITSDISRPWSETGAVINEVNFAPSLGSGEISRRYLKEYVARLVPGTGRIPTRVFVGDGEALEAARAHKADLAGQGLAAFLTTASRTVDAAGEVFSTTARGLQGRVRALVHCHEVEALVMVVQDHALLDTPLPLDAVDEVVVVNDRIGHSGEAPQAQRTRRLMRLLSRWAAGRVRGVDRTRGAGPAAGL